MEVVMHDRKDRVIVALKLTQALHQHVFLISGQEDLQGKGPVSWVWMLMISPIVLMMQSVEEALGKLEFDSRETE